MQSNECKGEGTTYRPPPHIPAGAGQDGQTQSEAAWREERAVLAHLPHYWQKAVPADKVAEALGWPLDYVKTVLTRMKERPGSWLRWTAFRDFGDDSCLYYRLTWQEAATGLVGQHPDNPRALPDDLRAEMEALAAAKAEGGLCPVT